jgi:tetrahydromethanopterin S-methyltransferase subunit H
MLAGSIFYDRHSIVADAGIGTFDEGRAATLLDVVDGLSLRYGVQMAHDVIAMSPEAMARYLAFVAARSPLPMLLNSADRHVRVAGLEAAARLGVLGRCVYASLNDGTEEFELEALRRHRPAAVMVLVHDADDPSPEACVAMVERFRPMLADIGVEVPIVDVAVVGPESVGCSMRAVTAVREAFGYPAGCAFANCLPLWPGLEGLGRERVNLTLAVALAGCRVAGADFLHYGLIERAAVAAHAAGTAEVFLGAAARRLDGRDLPENHPVEMMLDLAWPRPEGRPRPPTAPRRT